MLLHPLARGEQPAVLGAFRFLQVRHTRRRRWWWGAQEDFHDPLASQHRRGPVGVGRQRENAAVAQQASPLVVRIGDAPEVVSRDVRHAVVPCEALVDEGVVRSQQL